MDAKEGLRGKRRTKYLTNNDRHTGLIKELLHYVSVHRDKAFIGHLNRL
jgi:hypothetical protein